MFRIRTSRSFTSWCSRTAFGSSPWSCSTGWTSSRTCASLKGRHLRWLARGKGPRARAPGNHQAFAAFGFGTVLQTPEKVYLRGTDAGVPSVILRSGPRTKFLGPTFRAADEVDVLKLADATGRRLTRLPDDIGGVAEMDPETGVISPGGIGFDINCGMRLVLTNLTEDEVRLITCVAIS